jgi:diguanylate cyclase (GGDEF)-like protein
VSTIRFNITASIGISIYPDDGQDAVTLLKNADIAMYWVKEKGRNGYQSFSRIEKKERARGA